MKLISIFAFGAMDVCGACKVIKVAMILFEMENLIQTN